MQYVNYEYAADHGCSAAPQSVSSHWYGWGAAAGCKVCGQEECDYEWAAFYGTFSGESGDAGSAIIEALAQTGAVAILCQDEWKGKTAYFAGINNAKFKQKVVPGDTLELTTEIIKVKGPIGVGKAVARVNGKVACMAELTFAIG